MSILAIGPIVAATMSASSGHGTMARAVTLHSPSASTSAPSVNDASVTHQLPLAVDFGKPVPTPTPEPTPIPTPEPTAPPAPPVQAPAPAAPQVNYSAGSVEAIIQDAAARHGVDGNWMIRIASCESGLNPRAYNPSGPYIGLFQFLESTFRAHGGTDIYSAEQQSDITAAMLANGQANSWPVCSHR